ncbi:MAG TPA: hypothetical protein EYQ61_02395 [Dehalococcoidia bacterium]|nr:hypothetical protein [Dehalococcoidia bacterium]HIK89318.1 hypothetical protein [Dehalococcoidia bacterium]
MLWCLCDWLLDRIGRKFEL